MGQLLQSAAIVTKWALTRVCDVILQFIPVKDREVENCCETRNVNMEICRSCYVDS